MNCPMKYKIYFCTVIPPGCRRGSNNSRGNGSRGISSWWRTNPESDPAVSVSVEWVLVFYMSPIFLTKLLPMASLFMILFHSSHKKILDCIKSCCYVSHAANFIYFLFFLNWQHPANLSFYSILYSILSLPSFRHYVELLIQYRKCTSHISLCSVPSVHAPMNYMNVIANIIYVGWNLDDKVYIFYLASYWFIWFETFVSPLSHFLAVDTCDAELLSVMAGLADGSQLTSPEDHDALLSTQTPSEIFLYCRVFTLGIPY